MNSSQIHLAFTHVPVILSLVGLVVLITGLSRRNDTVIKTAFYLLLFAGLFSVPVYFSGEGAEELIEHLPGISEDAIEEHEELAKFAFAAAGVAGAFSLAGLMLYGRITTIKWLRPLVLVLALVSSGIMVITAHRGGLVRHPEIQSDFKSPVD